MDMPPDHRNGSTGLPAWPTSPLSPAMASASGPQAWDEFPDPEAAPPRMLSLRVLMRTIRRHWWQILLLWTILSAGLVAVVTKYVKPSYEAAAILQVEPTNRSVLAPTAISNDLGAFMETQLQLLTSSDVVSLALKNPKVAALPRIRMALDPETMIKKQLRVSIPPKSHVIVVSLSTASPTDGALIVNSVVDAYTDVSTSLVSNTTLKLIKQYKEAKQKFEGEVERLREEMATLTAKTGNADPQSNPSLVALESYKRYHERLSQVEMERIEAEAALSVLDDAMRNAEQSQPTGATDPAQVEEEAERYLQADAEYRRILSEFQEVKAVYDQAERIVKKKASDPALKHHREHLGQLQRDMKAYRAAHLPTIREKIAAGTLTANSEKDDAAAQTKRDYQIAKLTLSKLQEEEAAIQAQLDEIKIERTNEGNDALKAEFLKTDLARATDSLSKVSVMLSTLELESSGQASVSNVSPAKPLLRPTSDNRKLMTVAMPVLALLATLGLFLLIEVRAGRVADPDDVAARVRVGVIGVVPPLPSALPARSPRALRDQRRKLEEFIQSLDHLRVVLCSRGPGGRRCALITSAVGGEGKTTLAAQLAGRCANAGLSTLLIDADLRRPSLGELLEVPEGLGLVDVLMGDSTPEEAMVVIGNAGGFHLLPAGTAGHDPSRLLQGERLGQLIARFREAFDIVIIDAPPVLAVPDALLLGRWADGAVIAVRHDTSRFPLVERAIKRMTTVGVSVLGVVVNGVRPTEASYENYHYHSSHYADVGTPTGGGLPLTTDDELPG
jgi:capsular exopolysaccharide synthesis family protein